jgi:hypothetical protein
MITPIETRYAGCRFRSRLEARWAVFMDALGVPWEYEPQGYALDGTPYLPDFLIHPNTPRACWLEIKSQFPDGNERALARALAAETGIPACLYFAPIGMPAPDLSPYEGDIFEHLVQTWTWSDHKGWVQAPHDAADYQIGLAPTAFHFRPFVAKDPKREIRSGFLWWTECPHCGQFLIRNDGRPGPCPSVDWDAYDWRTNPGPDPWANFGHHTPRLLAAYAAARSARFEHGETP